MKDPEVATSQGPGCSAVWKTVQGRSVPEESSYGQWHRITFRSFISHKSVRLVLHNKHKELCAHICTTRISTSANRIYMSR